jgi:O-antigen/teichoic acid export membrane protein
MGVGTGLSILCSIAVTKYIAVSMGPAGTGLYAILLQLHGSALAIATFGGGAQNSLVRGVACRSGEDSRNFLGTVLSVVIVVTLITTVLLIMLAPGFVRLLHDSRHSISVGLIRFMAISVFTGVCASILMAVINGFRAIKALAKITVINSITSLLLVAPAVYFAKRGHPSALVLMIAISLLIQASFALVFVLRQGWLRELLLFRFSGTAVKEFLGLASATLTTSMVAQGAALLLQAWILRTYGLESLGIVSAATLISTGYLMLLLNAISTYYLPALSGVRSDEEARILIRNMYRFVVLVGVPLITTVIVFKPLIVGLLYSNRFAPSLVIIRWMLVASFFRTIAWILATPVFVRGEIGILILSEVAWNVFYVGSAIVISSAVHSLEVIGICYLASYVAYLAYFVHYVHGRYPRLLGSGEMGIALVGSAVVVIASAILWNRTTVRWDGLLVLVLAVLGSWSVLSSDERIKIRHAIVVRLPGW